MRTYTCIICPNGCEISLSGDESNPTLSGALCAKGAEYVRQERSDPRRTISSLVAVDGGERPLVSVRITSPIPRGRIADAMAAIKAMRIPAPVAIGDVLAADFLGLGCDLIAIDDNDYSTVDTGTIR